MGNTNKKKRNQKQHSRYVIVCKAENKGNDSKFVKYRCHDLQKLVVFLDREYPKWCWFNVFSNDGANKGLQLASYTRNRLPSHPFVS